MNIIENQVPLLPTTKPNELIVVQDDALEQVIGGLHLNLTQPECSGGNM